MARDHTVPAHRIERVPLPPKKPKGNCGGKYADLLTALKPGESLLLLAPEPYPMPCIYQWCKRNGVKIRMRTEYPNIRIWKLSTKPT